MKNQIFQIVRIVIFLSGFQLTLFQADGQIPGDHFYGEDDSIQIYRAQHFNDMRRYADGTLPGVWQAFQDMKEELVERSGPVPAADWINLGPDAMDSLAGRMTCHAFNPFNSQTLLAASSSGGLWKTTDGGDYWFPLTDDLPSLRISAVAINPQDTNHLLIGTGFYQGNSFTLVPGVGLLESFDSGETWLPNSLAYPLSDGVSINRIIWDRDDPNKLYVAATNGLWVSENRGESWDNTLDGLVCDLEIVRSAPERLFAAVHSVGIYRSDDSGQDWTLLTNGLPANQDVHRINIAVSESAPGFALASFVKPGSFGLKGLFKTSDGGDSWSPVSNPPSYLCNTSCLGWFVNMVAVSPVDTNLILLGGPRLYRTVNGGQSWHWRDYYSRPVGTNKEGLAYVDQWNAGFDPEDPNVVYVFNDGGVHKSYDKGFYWEKKNQGLVTAQMYRIASFRGDTNLIIGGVQDHGLQFLDNAGGNRKWDLWYIGDGCALSFDPNNPNQVYGDNIFGVHYRNSNVRSGLSATASFNTGITGTNSVPFHFVTTHHPTQSRILYTANDSRIFKSTNGLTWTAAANIDDVRAIAISPANPSTIYAAAYDNSTWSFHVSHNDGQSWQQTANAPGWRVTDVEGDPNHYGIVYATRNSAFPGNPHVYKSTDHGETWRSISDGLPDIPTWTITVNPFDSDIVYIGTDLGVFISQDGGDSWNEYNDNLPPYYVMDMHYHPLDSTLRIATLGRGVWKTKSVPDIETGTTRAEFSFPEVRTFPNPFSSTANIEVHLEQSRHVRLSILNVLGQEVQPLFEGQLPGGPHRFSWNGRNAAGSKAAPGIYLVRIETGAHKLVKKIVLQ